MTGAQFEISIDGVPRTYRDRKDLAFTSRADSEVQKPQQCGQAKGLADRGRDRRRVQGGATITEALPFRPVAGLAQVQEPCRAGGPPRGE
jgi:hypothetical protein